MSKLEFDGGEKRVEGAREESKRMMKIRVQNKGWMLEDAIHRSERKKKEMEVRVPGSK